MKINFIKVNPIENMTIFVINQFPHELHMSISKKLMDYGNLYAEQIGFIEKAQSKLGQSLQCLRLQMMGGEFCGNAARSLAAVLVQKQYVGIKKKGNKFIVPIEVSGINDVIYCSVEKTDEDLQYISEVPIPIPLNINNFNVFYNSIEHNTTLVEFHGISHAIVDSRYIDNKEGFYHACRKNIDISNLDALGIMFFNPETYYLEPLVYVKATNSLILERGCASGTAAVGALMCSSSQKDIELIVNQPGGQLFTSSKWENNSISKLDIKGTVKIIAEGIAYI